jgi:hypothetical protein
MAGELKPDAVVFDTEKGTLLLSVLSSDIDFPEVLRKYAESYGLKEKDEPHITIFGFDVGKRILDRIEKSSGNAGESIVDNIHSIINDTDWTFTLKNEAYRISKTFTRSDGEDEMRESIIQMIDIEAIKEFLDKINALLSVHLSIPPLHITLFSKSSNEENMLAGIGVSSADDLRKRNPVPIDFVPKDEYVRVKTIYTPSRPQTDTCIAILILRRYGKDIFPGIEDANYEVVPRLGEGDTEESLRSEGIFLIDVGGGVFDHHNKPFQTIVSHLVARFLEVDNNQALAKLLQIAERDDFFGKGVISEDPLDRAFGLPSLITVLNKKFVKEPGQVIETILPVLEAFLDEEIQRVFEIPKEFKEKTEQGKTYTFMVRQGKESYKCIYIESDNVSMAGFLRARAGGNYDVVAVRLSSGHVNILTRQTTRADLRSLVVLLRMQEADAKGITIDSDAKEVAVAGTFPSIPEWFYDTATNSIFNGGPNPVGISPTKIDSLEFLKLLEIGLSQALWVPPKI